MREDRVTFHWILQKETKQTLLWTNNVVHEEGLCGAITATALTDQNPKSPMKKKRENTRLEIYKSCVILKWFVTPVYVEHWRHYRYKHALCLFMGIDFSNTLIFDLTQSLPDSAKTENCISQLETERESCSLVNAHAWAWHTHTHSQDCLSLSPYYMSLSLSLEKSVFGIEKVQK